MTSLKAQSFSWVLLAASLAGGSSQAAPVTYLESVSGDLPGNGSLTILLLDVGVNTIRGLFGASNNELDLDSFAFIVPPGSEVVAATVRLTDVLGDVIDTRWALWRGSSFFSNGTFIEELFSTSPGSSSLLNGPLAADIYNFSHSGFTWTFQGASQYTFSLTVQQATVPEPASLALVGVALLLATTARRRSA